jgi:hypothetical protein
MPQASSEMSQQAGGPMISGRSILARSQPAPSEMNGVSVGPPGISTLTVMPSLSISCRPDRRHRFQRGLQRAVRIDAQHGAEACRVVDDAPKPRSRMCGSAACTISIGARRLMA